MNWKKTILPSNPLAASTVLFTDFSSFEKHRYLSLEHSILEDQLREKKGQEREKQEDVLEKIRRCIFHFWITLISLPSPSANTPSPSWISESPKLLTFMKWTSLYSLSVEWQAIIEIFWGKSRRGKITNNNGLLLTPWFFNVEAISWFLNWVSSTLKKIRHCNSRIGEKVVEVESQTTVAYSHFMIL
jgi:hypothetical protein